jgi:GNAT superfamily N-acetyltransferase
VEEIAAPRLLGADDETNQFDCGVAALDDWLKKRALVNHLSGASRTYVATTERRIVAYYCLSAGAVHHGSALGNIRRNMPEPIPVLVMGRLAVDRRYQGRGLGAALLRHALETTGEIANIAGIRALLVHAKDETAARFYRRFEFVASPSNPLVLMAKVS